MRKEIKEYKDKAEIITIVMGLDGKRQIQGEDLWKLMELANLNGAGFKQSDMGCGGCRAAAIGFAKRCVAFWENKK